MGPSGRKRACCVTVSSLDRSRATSGTPRGLLWGTNRRGGPACCGWGGRGNTLRGCDLPLPVGEAFFGGRTGAVALHAVAGEGEEIRYVDVTSLYRWVNKNCPYPIGHSQIITQPIDQSLGSYFDIATVDILPPAGLFHPVLPVRSGQKLTFPLCRTCVQEEQAKPMLSRNHYCSRSVADRTLRGTWCTPSWSKRWKRGTP